MAKQRGKLHEKVKREAAQRRQEAGRSKGVSVPRERPSLRAQARRSKTVTSPMPSPPQRRVPTQPTGQRPSTSSAGGVSAQEVQMAISQLRNQFSRLESAAQLPDVYNALGEIDNQLIQLPLALETLRTRGFVHARQLDDELETLDDKWDDVRPKVETTLQSQVRQLDTELDQAERYLSQLSLRPNVSQVRSAETAVSRLEQQISGARRALLGLYTGLDSELDGLAYRIREFSTMLDLIEQSPAIHMRAAEAPLLASQAEWEQDGADGPDGLLVLTDQRLMFEQREEVVTKRRFGIFATETEKVQKLLLELSVHEIEGVVDKEEGGFLGMGKDDILELTFKATAPVSRARFHIQGEESAYWSTIIKRIQTGEIDRDRADEYVDDMEDADETAAAFPEFCPTCFAPVPPQPRGITSYTCQFCGTEITPVVVEETAVADADKQNPAK